MGRQGRKGGGTEEAARGAKGGGGGGSGFRMAVLKNRPWASHPAPPLSPLPQLSASAP